MQNNSNNFKYSPSSEEETSFRRALEGAILEFGEPQDFESGSMTRPLLQKGKSSTARQHTKSKGAPEYYMLQEDGVGFSIFAATRLTYAASTPVEPVRLAVQLVTVHGAAVIDVAIPSRYAANDQTRPRAYDEMLGPHVRIDIVSRTKGAKLKDILDAFVAAKNAPAKELTSLLTVMREQGETRATAPLAPESLKLLTAFITTYFGDFSAKAPEAARLAFEEIIPETSDEVPKSDHWIRGVAFAAEEERAFEKQQDSSNNNTV